MRVRRVTWFGQCRRGEGEGGEEGIILHAVQELDPVTNAAHFPLVGPKIKSGDGRGTKLMLGNALLIKAICADPERMHRFKPRSLASAKVDTVK